MSFCTAKKKIIIASCICAVGMSGCSFGISSGNINRGIEAIEEGDYSNALIAFDEAITKEENLTQAYRGQGIAHMGLYEYTEAVKSFEKALKQSNGFVRGIDYDISYYLAIAEYKNGNIDKAIDTYTAIIDLDKKAVDAYFLRGKMELEKGDKDAAVADFDKVIEFEPTDYDRCISIYETLDCYGFNADGLTYIENALNTTNKKTDYQYGLLSYYLGRFDEAKTYLEKAREISESDELVLYLGRCYEQLGDINYATSLYASYLDRKSANAAIYNELGLMKLKLEDYNGALSAFDSGLTLNDELYNRTLRFNEIVAYEYINDFEKAQAAMNEYLKLYPNDEEALREEIFLSTR